MIEYLQSRSELNEPALELALSDKQPFAWRAAWLLSNCLKEDDKMLTQNQMRIIQAIPYKQDGHQRELLKLLSLINIHYEDIGILFDVCLDIWKQIHKIPSTRITAMKMIMQIAAKYPELRNEINCYAGEHYLETLSPGIKKVTRKMLQ